MNEGEGEEEFICLTIEHQVFDMEPEPKLTDDEAVGNM